MVGGRKGSRGRVYCDGYDWIVDSARGSGVLVCMPVIMARRRELVPRNILFNFLQISALRFMPGQVKGLIDILKNAKQLLM